jgi:hypothetical protein
VIDPDFCRGGTAGSRRERRCLAVWHTDGRSAVEPLARVPACAMRVAVCSSEREARDLLREWGAMQ